MLKINICYLKIFFHKHTEKKGTAKNSFCSGAHGIHDQNLSFRFNPFEEENFADSLSHSFVHNLFTHIQLTAQARENK
jgi:hypothetical protein